MGTSDAQNFVVGVNGISRGIFTQQGSFIGGAGATDLGALPAHAFGATPPTGSFIWGGGHKLAVLTGNTNYAAVFGNRNEINSSNGFTTGVQNIIGTGSVASMVSGIGNNLGNNFQTSIVTGRSNTMNYTFSDATNFGNGNIIAGHGNNLSNSSTGVAPRGAIVGGYLNTITADGNGFLLTGTGNTISGSMTNAAVVGTYNTPVDNSLFTVGNGVSGTPNNAMVVLGNGNVGVGTDAPSNRLHVNATNPARLQGLQAGAATDAIVTTDGTGVLRTVTAASLASSVEPWQIQGGTAKATANTDNIYQQGSVAIGIAGGASIPAAEVTANNPKLYVAGNVSATGSFITTTSKYADYVFEDYFDGASKINADYDFKSLAETAAYIKANKHLPGVTAIKDILKTKDGYTVNLSELSIQQLEKIEELYLHTIEQQEEISKQKTEISDLKSRMEKLEQLLVKENNNK